MYAILNSLIEKFIFLDEVVQHEQQYDYQRCVHVEEEVPVLVSLPHQVQDVESQKRLCRKSKRDLKTVDSMEEEGG